MRVYEPNRDPKMASQKDPLPRVPSPALPSTEKAMSRRPIALLVLAITSFVLSACTSATAPTASNDSSSCGGWVGSDGRCLN
jgi:hypothetical protein